MENDYCFDINGLYSSDFNVSAWVEAISSSTPLEVIQKDLMKYFETIKSELIDCVNHDYATFVELSSHLKQIKQILDSLEQPLNCAKLESDDINNNISFAKNTFNSIVERYNIIQEKKRKNELFDNIEQLLNKCERILHVFFYFII